MGGEVMLDEQIRNWVLIPIPLVVFLVGVLRNNLAKLMHSERKGGETKSVREGQAIFRARWLRRGYGLISLQGFLARKDFFVNKDTGALKADGKQLNPQQMMMQDPNMMMDMMKKNFSMIGSQLLLGGFINFFFSGFVMAKIPFPLTNRFRQMLQRGVDIHAIDVTYVSSLSWYFLNLFGMRGVNSLVFGDSMEVDDLRMMQMQQQMTAGAPTDAVKMEHEMVDMMTHESGLPKIEERCLQLLRARVQGAPGKEVVGRVSVAVSRPVK
eukprot:jgi/Mesvir1/10893/Mv11172-RA.1